MTLLPVDSSRTFDGLVLFQQILEMEVFEEDTIIVCKVILLISHHTPVREKFREDMKVPVANAMTLQFRVCSTFPSIVAALRVQDLSRTKLSIIAALSILSGTKLGIIASLRVQYLSRTKHSFIASLRI